MTRQERLNIRNNNVRKHFIDLQKKNPKWRYDAIVEEVASKFFLSSRTIEAIINHEGTYSNNQTEKPKNEQLTLFQKQT